MQPRQEKQHYTYADYIMWDDDKWELIDGTPYMMASPSTNRNRISGRLENEFRNHLRGKTCEVFDAPFDVRLDWAKGDDTVVQPDLLVVCDPNKIDDAGCKGAPDLIIEVLSPSTAKYDITTKFTKYRESGVKELWYVDPAIQVVMVRLLRNGAYVAENYGPTDKITVDILPELIIDLKDIFDTESTE